MQGLWSSYSASYAKDYTCGIYKLQSNSCILICFNHVACTKCSNISNSELLQDPSSMPSPTAPTSKTIYVGIRVKPVDDHIGSIVGRSNSVALWSSVSLLYVNFVAYNLNSVALGGFIIRCRVTFR